MLVFVELSLLVSLECCFVVSVLKMVEDLYTFVNSWPAILFLAIISFVAVKIVKIFSRPETPKLFLCQTEKNQLINDLILQCPKLLLPYKPPFLWGRNGHIQTGVYGILGHASLRRVASSRQFVQLPDGTVITFDIFEPLTQCFQGDFTLALCPGIANSSESNYIRTCVHHAQEAGFRCAVLNHLGALKDVKLTTPRIFTYGGTEEYAAMIKKLTELYPSTKFISIGFSMGANIVTKYLGELSSSSSKCNERIALGISVGQGYDAVRTCGFLHSWEGGRRAYMYIMTENVKRLLRNHYNEVIEPLVQTNLIEQEPVLWGATSLYTIDDCFTRKCLGFEKVEDYLKWCSSVHIIQNIKTPMIFLNAEDDPLTPWPLLEPITKFCESKPGFLFILTKHGGHLGFLEGSSFRPQSVTWLDRLIVQLANGVINLHSYN